jgi:hypothetical protein
MHQAQPRQADGEMIESVCGGGQRHDGDDITADFKGYNITSRKFSALLYFAYPMEVLSERL